MNTKRAHRRTRGLTLIELLICLAIIALLAGLVVPGIYGVLERVEEMSCAVNLRSVTIGMRTYTADYRCFPFIRHTTTRDGPKDPEYRMYWTDYVVFNNDNAVFGWTNLGLLWSPKADGNPNVPEGKYIKNEDHYWCPKFFRKNESYDLGLGGCPWPPGKDPQNRWFLKTKATYSRRPACAGKLPDRIPPGAAIVSDYFPRSWWYSQLPEHIHRNARGFNVGYYGGTVDWYDDFDGLALDAANFVGGSHMESARRTETSWRHLDKCDVPWTPEAYLD
jgi:prepilin-type N-terminal cleavage/methylation domain-containing protein